MKILPSGISKQSKSLTDWKELTKKAQAFDGNGPGGTELLPNEDPASFDELVEAKIEIDGQAGGWRISLVLGNGFDTIDKGPIQATSIENICAELLKYS